MERRNPSPPANDSVPLELAVRLLGSHSPYMELEEKPRLFAGSIPDDPPFDVRIPDGFSLVGSATLTARPASNRGGAGHEQVRHPGARRVP